MLGPTRATNPRSGPIEPRAPRAAISRRTGQVGVQGRNDVHLANAHHRQARNTSLIPRRQLCGYTQRSQVLEQVSAAVGTSRAVNFKLGFLISSTGPT